MRDVDPARPWTRRYPDWVPDELPIATESMADVLEATARAVSEAPAIHDFDATISYARLEDLASRFATLLAAWGIGPGDRVALYLQNVPQYLIALYGIWKRGAIAGPDSPATPDEIIEFCRSKIAAYKYPRQVEIVDEIPETVTGKFLRRALRDLDTSRKT